MALTLSCSEPEVPTGTFVGFQIETIPGSDVGKAVKMESGVLVEDGYVLNSQKHGAWIAYHPDGRIKNIDHFIGGKRNGVALVFDNRGQISSKSFYTNDVYDGQKVSYRFGRAEEVVPYVNGVIHGRVTKYYTNGKVMEENDFVDGKQDGYYRHYSEAGQMDLEYVYKNGEKVSGGIVTPPDAE